MQTSHLLNLIADDLEANGWTIGNQGMSVAGPHCVEGALCAVTGAAQYTNTTPKYIPTDAAEGTRVFMYPTEQHPALVALREHTGSSGDSMWSWNDKQPSGEVVVEALRAAAVIEAAREQQTVAVPEQRVVAS